MTDMPNSAVVMVASGYVVGIAMLHGSFARKRPSWFVINGVTDCMPEEKRDRVERAFARFAAVCLLLICSLMAVQKVNALRHPGATPAQPPAADQRGHRP